MGASTEKLRKVLHQIQIDTTHFRPQTRSSHGFQKPGRPVNRTAVVDRYKKRRLDTGATNGTVNRELATLSHLMNKAVEWKWLQSKPCKVSKLEESEGRIIALTDNQVEALINAALADAEPDCWLRLIPERPGPRNVVTWGEGRDRT